MATSYTSLLRLAQPAQGELSGTWGTVVNDNITAMVEEAISGSVTLDTWVADSHTLTTVNGTTDESRPAMLFLTDTTVDLSGAGTLICPTATKPYIVKNDTGQTITVKTSAGTGVAVGDGNVGYVFCDGTNVESTLTAASATVSGVVELATQLEVDTGTDTTRAVTPATLASATSVVVAASETASGIAELATTAEVATGTDDLRIVTPLKLEGWDGSTAITSVGTIGTGTWQGTAVDAAYLTGVVKTASASIKTSGALTFNDNIYLNLGTGADVNMYSDGANAYFDLNAGIGDLYIRDGTTTRYTFADDGDLTLATGRVLAESGSAAAPTYAFGSNADTGMYNSDTDNISFATNGGERMRIFDDGHIGFNSLAYDAGHHFRFASPSGVNTLYVQRLDTTVSAVPIWKGLSSTVVTSQILTDGTYQNLSDANFKTNVEPVNLGLDAVMALNPISFYWKDDNGEADGDRNLGFLAQEVEPIVDEAVAIDDQGNYCMAQATLLPVMVKAIQELTARVAELEAKK